MLGAEHTHLGLEVVLVERLGVLVTLLGPEQVGQAHLVEKGIGVVLAVQALADLERLAIKGFGLVRSTLLPMELRNLAHCLRGVWVFVSERAAAELERPLQLRFGRGILPEREVGFAKRA